MTHHVLLYLMMSCVCPSRIYMVRCLAGMSPYRLVPSFPPCFSSYRDLVTYYGLVVIVHVSPLIPSVLDLCLHSALRPRRFIVLPCVLAHSLYHHTSTYLVIKGFLFDSAHFILSVCVVILVFWLGSSSGRREEERTYSLIYGTHLSRGESHDSYHMITRLPSFLNADKR